MKKKSKLHSKKSSLLYDVLVVLATPLIATFITVYFQTNQVISLFLFFMLPGLYLTAKKPWIFKKAIFPVLCSIPFCIIIDHFAIKDGSWWVHTIFPFRVLNTIPIEDFIWCASWFYYILAFYEYFVDQPRGGKDYTANHGYRKVLAAWYGLCFFFLLFFNYIDQNIYIPYFYALFALVLGFIPTAVLLVKKSHLFHKFGIVLLYFFYTNFLHEISALSANQWYFPGNNFIGWVQIFQFRFPFEEFALWMLLGSTYLLTWYEYFEDNGR